jgi:N-acetylneuraminic acid mutarotase
MRGFGRQLICVLALLFCGASIPARAAVPLVIHYQGHLTVKGTGLEGTGHFKFALINGEGKSVWSHDGTSFNGTEPTTYLPLVLRRGVYAIQLGDTTISNMAGLHPEVFLHSKIYLRVWFSDRTNRFEVLSPDRQMGSVAYSIISERAAHADVAATVTNLPSGLLEERHLPAGFTGRVARLEVDLAQGTNALVNRLLATNNLLTGALAGERAARENADNSISSTLVLSSNALFSRLAGTNALLVSTITAERSARESAVTVLSNSAHTASNSLQARLLGTNNLLLTTIGSEKATREAAEAALSLANQTTSNALVLRLLATNALLTNEIALERSARQAGDSASTTANLTTSNALRGQILATNSLLVTSIDAERSAREAANASLNSGILTTSNALVSRLSATNSLLVSSIATEKAAREAAQQLLASTDTLNSNALFSILQSSNALLLAALAEEKSSRTNADLLTALGLLNGTNLWTGTNHFREALLATNQQNQIAGTFAGVFQGDATALTNLPASAVAGTLSVTTIPALDGSKLTSGLIPDARLSGNIARVSDVLNSSNSLKQNLVDTNAILSERLGTLLAQLEQLTTHLNSLSNQVRTPNQRFMPMVSADPQDAELAGLGYQLFMTIPAPGWTNAATLSAASLRYNHAGVWTGSELLIWGGNFSAISYTATGSRYSPENDQWTSITPVNAPAARSQHSAVWTGQEMVVWGGFSGTDFLQSGARYSPVSQSWQATTTSGAPSARDGHVAVWNGSRMVIWGGKNADGFLNDGALYDPTNNVWYTIQLPNTPEARFGASAVWAGDRLLLFGGEGQNGPLNSGAQLIFFNGVPVEWRALPTINAPTARSGHTAVWNGSSMIVWGGQQSGSYLSSGAVYNLASNVWTTMNLTGGPAGRAYHGAVWTGTEMVVHGGENGFGSLSSSAAFDPITSTWRAVGATGNATARSGPLLTWTGTEILAFGGKSAGQAAGPLQRLNLQPAWYFYRKP